MASFGEDFFLKIGLAIDSSLPIRLQKRQLLRILGFPTSGEIRKCQAGDKEEVERLFRQFMVGHQVPFNIVISEKEMMSWIPPLCEVRTLQDIKWRDRDGSYRTLRQDEVLEELANLTDETWLEFVPNLWGGRNMAGRLIYIDSERQCLEIQESVKPAQLICKGSPLFSGDLSFFDIRTRDYADRAKELHEIGYTSVASLYRLRAVIDQLFPHRESFEKLRALGELPTYEFAYLVSGQIISIDIDWPNQWLEKGVVSGGVRNIDAFSEARRHDASRCNS